MVIINSLKFNDVTLKFGGITALNNVSFEVKPKTLYAIIGPNGAGKTSIFNCISGIYRPTDGSIMYGDQNIKDLRPDEVANLGVARTFQNIELFENMTVLDNILIGVHILAILYYQIVKKMKIIQRVMDGYSRIEKINIVSINEMYCFLNSS